LDIGVGFVDLVTRLEGFQFDLHTNRQAVIQACLTTEMDFTIVEEVGVAIIRAGTVVGVSDAEELVLITTNVEPKRLFLRDG